MSAQRLAAIEAMIEPLHPDRERLTPRYCERVERLMRAANVRLLLDELPNLSPEAQARAKRTIQNLQAQRERY